MTAKVEIRDGETIQEALRRFRHAVRHVHRRQWYKTRPGSYDKPSYRRRRKEVLRRRNMRRNGLPGYVTVYVGLTGLFAPTAPFTYRRNKKKLESLHFTTTTVPRNLSVSKKQRSLRWRQPMGGEQSHATEPAVGSVFRLIRIAPAR
jgi:ribosomal protein S21